MRIRTRVTTNVSKLKSASKSIQSALNMSLHDVGDDLVRASSGAAPHETGYLESSWNKKVDTSPTQGSVEVSYRAYNRGFNYALKMHEGSYNLGEGSRRKPGGVGMSGKRYPVGAKFLERPLMGERSTYQKHVKERLARNLKALD